MQSDAQAKFINCWGDIHSPREWNRLFLISLKKRYVFCPLPKVANSSLKAFLYEAEMREAGMKRQLRRLDKKTVHNVLFGPLLKPFQLPDDMLATALTDKTYSRFVFVRHPVNRLVSCYLDRVQTPRSGAHKDAVQELGLSVGENIPFGDFVELIAGQTVQEMNLHWRPQYHECRFDLVPYDNVYRFETMSEGMQEVLGRYYPTVADRIDGSLNYSPKATGAGSRVEELVTPALNQMIRKIYSEDFRAFGYD